MPRRKDIRTRDHLMVKVINGATKAAVHRDERKEAARSACRATQFRELAQEMADAHAEVCDGCTHCAPELFGVEYREW